MVNSNDVAFNAVSGTLTFPPSVLEVVSISKGSSVVSLWVQEPTFSNTAGSVSFEGIVLNPGYKGSNANIVSVQFRVKKAGTATISFTSGEILANDGIGTSILSSLGTGTYSLVTKPAAPPVEDPPVSSTQTPAEVVTEVTAPPTVVSSSHPDDAWSNKTSGTFAFQFKDDIISMRLLADTVPDSIPVVVYQPPITERTINDLAEGVSYLHVQLKDKNGWGEVKHYKLQIYTKAPEQVLVKEVAAPDNALLTFLLTASDTASGIEKYELSIDGGEEVTVMSSGTETFFSPSGLVAGKHTLGVKVYDKAGNFTFTSLQFEVKEEQPQNEVGGLLSGLLQNFNGFLIGLILLPLVLLIAGLLWLYLLTRARQQEQHIILATQAAKHDAVRAIMLLRTELESEVTILEKAEKKRSLTKEESKILKGAKKSFGETESYIQDYFTETTDPQA